MVRRRKKFMAFAAFLILAQFTVSSAFAQVPAATEPVQKGSEAAPAGIIKAEKPKRKLPTGLLQLTGFKAPVFLYVPEGLETDKKYPLIVMAPNESNTVEKQLEYILPTAKSLECFVLAFDAWPKEGVPYDFDRWLLKIKNDLSTRFPIDSGKVYVWGVQLGGHYAAYLMTMYPEEFSGAALVEQAWEGLYTQLLKPHTDAGQQMPVVVAYATNQQDIKTKNEKWVLEYQQKGYPVQVMDPPAGQDINSADFKVSLLEWLDQKGQAFNLIREEKNKTFKQRFKKGVKEFFEI